MGHVFVSSVSYRVNRAFLPQVLADGDFLIDCADAEAHAVIHRGESAVAAAAGRKVVESIV